MPSAAPGYAEAGWTQAGACCAASSVLGFWKLGGPGGNRTHIRGFAVRCITTLPPDPWRSLASEKPRKRWLCGPKTVLPGRSEFFQLARIYLANCVPETASSGPKPGAPAGREPSRQTGWSSVPSLGRGTWLGRGVQPFGNDFDAKTLQQDDLGALAIPHADRRGPRPTPQFRDNPGSASSRLIGRANRESPPLQISGILVDVCGSGH
jgi:hypothetical protein